MDNRFGYVILIGIFVAVSVLAFVSFNYGSEEYVSGYIEDKILAEDICMQIPQYNPLGFVSFNNLCFDEYKITINGKEYKTDLVTYNEVKIGDYIEGVNDFQEGFSLIENEFKKRGEDLVNNEGS